MTLTTLPDGSDEPIDAADVFDADIPAHDLLAISAASADALGGAGDSPAAVQFAFIAPQFLVPNAINRTFTDEDLADLLASVPVVGFLQAAVVVPTDPPQATGTGTGARSGPDSPAPDGFAPGEAQYYRVLIGNRRRATAARLDRPLPCLIVSGGDTSAVQEILAILAENDDRLALKPSEKADLYRQLTLSDWTPAKIAKARGVKTAEIKHALSLAGLPAAVRAAADSGQLPLALAPELAQLDDDPKALAAVLKKGNSWGFKHAVNDAIERRDRKQAADRLFAELVTADVDVVAKPAGFDEKTIKATAVKDLVDADGNPVDEMTVRTLPGFKAFINKTGYGAPNAVVFCADPEKHGYTRTGFSQYVSDAQKAERQAELAAAEEHRAALRAAARVRREFLVAHYGNARRAKAAQPEVLRAVISDPGVLSYPLSFSELADEVAGVRIADAAATAGTDRLARMLVARWVTTSEANLDAVASRRSWGIDEPAAAYLEGLVDAGYELSDAEQHVLTELTARLTPVETDDTEDGDTEEDDTDEDDDSEHDDYQDEDEDFADVDGLGDPGERAGEDATGGHIDPDSGLHVDPDVVSGVRPEPSESAPAAPHEEPDAPDPADEAA